MFMLHVHCLTDKVGYAVGLDLLQQFQSCGSCEMMEKVQYRINFKFK